MTIDQMWEKFTQHQPEADRLGYGEAWRRMCEERTEEALEAARSAAWEAGAAVAAEAAGWTAVAAAVAALGCGAADAANANRCAEQAIKCINKAEGK